VQGSIARSVLSTCDQLRSEELGSVAVVGSCDGLQAATTTTSAPMAAVRARRGIAVLEFDYHAKSVVIAATVDPVNFMRVLLRTDQVYSVNLRTGNGFGRDERSAIR